MRRTRLAIGVVGAVAAWVAAHRRWRNWGATEDEVVRTMPGDELVAEPRSSVTRAVTVEAAADDVWPWLVQMGQGRAGMYSYDLLENLIGLDIHSLWHIDESLQDLEVGDRITLVRPGWAGLKAGFSLPVALIEPGRSLVLREDPSEGPWDAVWSFHVVPDGKGRCRLISRSTAHQQGRLAQVMDELMDPITLLMTRKMLLGIKERAEGRPRLAAETSL